MAARGTPIATRFGRFVGRQANVGLAPDELLR